MAQSADMSQYIMHDEFLRRLEEDSAIFSGITITDFTSLREHIRLLEAYASYVAGSVGCGELPLPFELFLKEYRYPSGSDLFTPPIEKE